MCALWRVGGLPVHRARAWDRGGLRGRRALFTGGSIGLGRLAAQEKTLGLSSETEGFDPSAHSPTVCGQIVTPTGGPWLYSARDSRTYQRVAVYSTGLHGHRLRRRQYCLHTAPPWPALVPTSNSSRIPETKNTVLGPSERSGPVSLPLRGHHVSPVRLDVYLTPSPFRPELHRFALLVSPIRASRPAPRRRQRPSASGSLRFALVSASMRRCTRAAVAGAASRSSSS